MNIAEIRALSDSELQEGIVAAKRDLFDLRFQKGTRREVKPHLFRTTRVQLAQMLTVERERQLKAATDAE
ncbi:MAG: 50S ribosomal protein L29 [Synechococcales bacterium]|nr:50S ribosomal protein L29 [Synechococcales bacterium]